MKNYDSMARNIIYEHTKAMISSETAEYKTNQALYEDMVEQCAFILSEKLIKGEITPMEYSVVRNKLCDMLWGIFEKHINDEGGIQ